MPGGKLSGGFMAGAQVSKVINVRRPWVNCPVGNCPEVRYPKGRCLVGSFPVGLWQGIRLQSNKCPSSLDNCPAGNCPEVRCPMGIYPVGSCPMATYMAGAPAPRNKSKYYMSIGFKS